MTTLIKNLFDIKRRYAVLTFFVVLLTCFSCEKNDDFVINITGEDLTGEPDKVIENIPCVLYYDKDFKMWCVKHSRPSETFDYMNRYFIVEMPDKEFLFEEVKLVWVSGLCYDVPRETVDNVYGINNNDDIAVDYAFVPYYIKVTDIKNQ